MDAEVGFGMSAAVNVPPNDRGTGTGRCRWLGGWSGARLLATKPTAWMSVALPDEPVSERRVDRAMRA